jgi:hypothetical protein
VAFDAGLASILLAIDDRHAFGRLRPITVVAPGCGQPSGVEPHKRRKADGNGNLQQAAASRARRKQKEAQRENSNTESRRGYLRMVGRAAGAGWLDETVNTADAGKVEWRGEGMGAWG